MFFLLYNYLKKRFFFFLNNFKLFLNFRFFYSFFFDFIDDFCLYFFSSHFFRSFFVLVYSQFKLLEHFFIFSNFVFLNRQFSLDWSKKMPVNTFSYYEHLDEIMFHHFKFNFDFLMQFFTNFYFFNFSFSFIYTFFFTLFWTIISFDFFSNCLFFFKGFYFFFKNFLYDLDLYNSCFSVYINSYFNHNLQDKFGITFINFFFKRNVFSFFVNTVLFKFIYLFLLSPFDSFFFFKCFFKQGFLLNRALFSKQQCIRFTKP